MSNTYRRMTVWVRDGELTFGNNGRKSRSRNKPIDRRIQRRQNAKLIREHKYLMDMDATYDRLEEIERINAEEQAWYVNLSTEYDLMLQMEDEDAKMNNDFLDHYHWNEPDYSYAAGSLSRSGITNLGMNTRIKGEHNS